MGCHPKPIDEAHDFSRWLLHHQPESFEMGVPYLEIWNLEKQDDRDPRVRTEEDLPTSFPAGPEVNLSCFG